jgi:hypothetical protein
LSSSRSSMETKVRFTVGDTVEWHHSCSLLASVGPPSFRAGLRMENRLDRYSDPVWFLGGRPCTREEKTWDSGVSSVA